LDENDLEQIVQLQNSVLGKLKQKELCVPIPKEEMLEILTGNGESVGFFVGDKLCAVCSLLFPVSYENNMALELNFSDEELRLVAQFELSLVDLDFRGCNLQLKLADILARRLEKRGEAKYLFTTVSPYNYPSIKTVTSLGLQIVKISKMYFNWDRYVVYKEFNKPVKLDTANSISILNTCLAEQEKLINEGYRGYSQFKDEEGIKIVFAKVCEN